MKMLGHTTENELDPAKGRLGAPDVARHCFQVLKQCCIHHGDLHAPPTSSPRVIHGGTYSL